MAEDLLQLFGSSGFLPHGDCFTWTPELLWMYVASDSVIGVAYYSIPLALTYFVRHRKDFPLNWMVVMFAVFIFACGTTHFMAVLNIWYPFYWLDAATKAVTAAVSIATAALVWPLIPRALALPSTGQMERANRDLQHEVEVRRQAEQEIKKLNERLEQRVHERTVEMEAANRELESQMMERKRTELALQQANTNLKRTIEQLARRGEDISRLRQMSEMLQSCATSDEANQVIDRCVRRLIPGYSGTLFLLDPRSSSFEARSTWGTTPSAQQTISAEECWALRRGKAHLIDGPDSNAACKHLPQPTPYFSVCVPLSAHGEVLGLLHLYRDGLPENGYGSQTEVVTRLAEAVTDHASVALANIKLRDSLRSQAILDPLTGLYNRRFMEEALHRETRLAERTGRPLGILMLDIDNFKQFNDSHGHETGDALMRELGRMLKLQIRSGDIACRFGGEEFVVILQESPPGASMLRAEQLRESIMSMRLPSILRPAEHVTVSIGVASFPENGNSWEIVLGAADRALYAAKEGGRDRVVQA